MPNYSLEEAINTLKNITKNKTCPKCNQKCKERQDRAFIARCTWGKCRAEFSLLNGTIFHMSRLSINSILNIINMWLLNGNSFLISKTLNISLITVRSILKKVSTTIVKNYYNKFDKIGGNGIIVEVDESKFGKRKYYRGHRVKGVWVVGMVERTAKRRILVIPVEKRDKNSLNLVLKRYVNSESIIYSDCWKGYSNLSLYFKDHLTVNHSVGFKNSNNGVHTNTIEGNWSSVKNSIPKVFRNKRSIWGYLIRYMLKRNEVGDPLVNIIKYLF